MRRPLRTLLSVGTFGAAFGLVEAAVVVYLRAIYYPDGFTFPLTAVSPDHLAVELFREAATIVMLVSVAVAAGGRGWERFGHFLVGFGVWDIFYYIWLFLFLRWPSSPFDFDVLFLLPVPWVAPVIAPVATALFMVWAGAVIVLRVETGGGFRPGLRSWLLVGAGVALLLYSWIRDLPAGLGRTVPEPYPYPLLVAGLGLMLWGFLSAVRPERRG